eukprot:1151659-Pelagomonas_calceolata.AAC.2
MPNSGELGGHGQVEAGSFHGQEKKEKKWVWHGRGDQDSVKTAGCELRSLRKITRREPGESITGKWTFQSEPHIFGGGDGAVHPKINMGHLPKCLPAYSRLLLATDSGSSRSSLSHNQHIQINVLQNWEGKEATLVRRPNDHPNRNWDCIHHSITDQARCTYSRPDAILVTPCPAHPSRPHTPPSHRVLRIMRGHEEVRSSTTPARQLHVLNIQDLHIQERKKKT